MFNLHDLRTKLQERRKRMHRVGQAVYENELHLFLEFVHNHPHLNSLIQTLEASEPISFEEWKLAAYDYDILQDPFPPSETARAKLCYCILKECAKANSLRVTSNWGRLYATEDGYSAHYEAVTDSVLDPFVDYLQDRLEEVSDVLYALGRFKLRVEWFRREELHRRYAEDTRHGEKNLDTALREALFEAGVDYPFSEPVSPSGRTDIAALLETDDPIVMEVKVYDPDSGKTKRNVSQGFHQVLQYADNYQKNVGYLVIFNCSDHQLVLPSDASTPAEYPPRVVYDGKTIFLLVIELSTERASASQEDPSSRVTLTREELLRFDGEATDGS